jgi:prepilin-type N-terminal cleavage/methylation domain-containing protein
MSSRTIGAMSSRTIGAVSSRTIGAVSARSIVAMSSRSDGAMKSLSIGAMRARSTRATTSPRIAALTRRGFTLIELILALALLALLMLAVFQLLDRSLSLWRRAETRQSLLEQASAIADLVAHDVRGVESGARGDLVAEWVRFDTDGDGIAETKWPRIRLVRQASAADVALVERSMRAAQQQGKDADDESVVDPASPGLIEVVWMVVPASTKEKTARAEGRLWRGERLLGDHSSKSFFADDFFGASNLPPAGATEEVSAGVLWMNLMFATQTSIVHDGWKLSGDPASVATSWDAWSRDRPDRDLHAWNEPAPGMAKAKAAPILPRRIRIELEFERAQDRRRRTSLAQGVDLNDSGLVVDDPDRIPREEEAYILVDSEWMRVRSVDGRTVVVQRGQRGTKAETHAIGTMVHYGVRLIRETQIAMFREDWNL